MSIVPALFKDTITWIIHKRVQLNSPCSFRVDVEKLMTDGQSATKQAHLTLFYISYIMCIEMEN